MSTPDRGPTHGSPHPGRRTLLRIAVSLLVMSGAAACGGTAPPASQLRSVSSTHLAFDTPISNGPKVFAHYMPMFPLSIDNKPADVDYYTTEYLSPSGENGIHAAYGGYLRDRPLPRAPSAQEDWGQRDVEHEIDQATSVGIDGFAVDVIRPRSESDVVDTILAAAADRPGFSVMLTMDMNGPVALGQSMSAFVADIVHYAASPASYRLPDHRLVLSAFRAEARTPEWWSGVLGALSDHGVQVAFLPLLLDVDSNLERFAPISYGIGYWGGRSPAAFSSTDPGRGSPADLANRSRRLGVKIMQPVAFQDSRPYMGVYSEADNGATMRAGWEAAATTKADLVEIMTWNDYAENSGVAPSMEHGYRLIDMMAYHIAIYKSGTAPPVRRDTVYATYRKQFYQARPTFPESALMTLDRDSSPAVNDVEITSYAVEPSSVTVRIGTDVQMCTVPAGVTTCRFPLHVGPVSVEMTRGGHVVAAAGGGPAVTATPTVQDLQYVAVGGLR